MVSGKEFGGYTIVEVMVFLSISGFLFLIAALALNGQQRRAEFSTGITDFQAKISDVVNDVSDGFYPSTGSFSCSTSFAGATPDIDASTPSAQGTNEDCVFMGKVVQLKTGSDEFYVHTVLGSRVNSAGVETTKFAESHPVALSVDVPSSVDTRSILSGFEVTGVYATIDPFPSYIPISSFGVFTEFPSLTNSGNDLNRGEDIMLVPLYGSDLANTTAEVASQISGFDDTWIYLRTEIVACLRHGDAGQRAALEISSHDRQLITALHIGNIDTAVPDIFGGSVSCP